MNTDLNKIKEATKGLARSVMPTPTDFGFIVIHPFVDSPIYMEKYMKLGLGSINVENIDALPKEINLLNKDTYKEWCDGFCKLIDSARNVAEVYMRWRTPYKLLFMDFCGEYLNPKAYAEYLNDAWVTEDNPNMDANIPIEKSLEWFKEANKKYLMTEEDYEKYLSFPDEFTVYRGVGKKRVKYGLSWTDDIEKAKWFQHRWGASNEETCLLKATIKKEHLVAYLNTRGEKECLVDVFAIKDLGLIEEVTEEL